MMRSTLSLVLLLGLLAFGCGGTDEGRPSNDPVPQREFDQCEAAEGYEFLSMVDFEPYMAGNDTSRSVRCSPELSQADTASCDFYFNYDSAKTPGGPDCVTRLVGEDEEVFSYPRLGQQTFDATEIDGRRCGEETNGLNIITQNVGMCVGSDGRVGWGAALDITFSPALDASEWDGVALWVRDGERGGQPVILVQLVDPYSSGGLPETDPFYCNATDPALASEPILDSEKCDSFGTTITLSDDWTFVPARFDEMEKRGFGVVSPLGRLKTDEILRMQILFGSGNANFWIDDIALFREED